MCSHFFAASQTPEVTDGKESISKDGVTDPKGHDARSLGPMRTPTQGHMVTDLLTQRNPWAECLSSRYLASTIPCLSSSVSL
jgi:hypothetical protein